MIMCRRTVKDGELQHSRKLEILGSDWEGLCAMLRSAILFLWSVFLRLCSVGAQMSYTGAAGAPASTQGLLDQAVSSCHLFYLIGHHISYL